MADDQSDDAAPGEMPDGEERDTEPKLNAEDVRRMQASVRKANKEAEALRLKLRETPVSPSSNGRWPR
jgi:hypothetical protein